MARAQHDQQPDRAAGQSCDQREGQRPSNRWNTKYRQRTQAARLLVDYESAEQALEQCRELGIVVRAGSGQLIHEQAVEGGRQQSGVIV
jgi:hypothetical protein